MSAHEVVILILGVAIGWTLGAGFGYFALRAQKRNLDAVRRGYEATVQKYQAAIEQGVVEGVASAMGISADEYEKVVRHAEDRSPENNRGPLQVIGGGMRGPLFTVEDRGHGRMPVKWGRKGKPPRD